MRSITDTFTLNNGLAIPCVGYGTFQTPVPETKKAVRAAIAAGYRHIDTAAFYGNEAGVGQAVRECGLPREELFVTSKVWNADRGYEKTLAAFDRSLSELGLDYVDLYLVHWPANYLQFGREAARLNAETWRALEEVCRAGRAKSIGLSNFLPHHIDALMQTAQIKPAVDQIEFHPGWNQRGVVRYCQDEGIVVEAWSPLGRREVLADETLTAVAAKYGKSTAQLCLRWVLQHGVLPLPKSVTPARIAANTQLFDFEIDAEDMRTLDKLDLIGGQCARPDDVEF